MRLRIKSDLVESLLIVLSIYVSGTIFGISFYYKESVTLLFLISIIYAALTIKRTTITQKEMMLLVLLVSIPCIVALTNGVSTLSSYVAVVMQILTSFLLSKSITPASFKNKFAKIMFFLAAVSIVAYVVYLLYPEVALFFPKKEGEASTDYYNAGLYVFQSLRGYGYFVPFSRNAGVFWEPGAYQAFLNVALLFIIDDDTLSYRQKAIMVLTICIAIITTYSTTGYIVMLLVFFANWRAVAGKLKRDSAGWLIYVLSAIIIISLLADYSAGGSFLLKKLSVEFVEGVWVERINLSDLTIFATNPVAVLGISFEKYATLFGMSFNSLVQTMISLGIPFTSALVYMYFRFCKQYKQCVFYSVILVLLFSTESLVWRAFFLCIAWYGVGGSYGGMTNEDCCT